MIIGIIIIIIIIIIIVMINYHALIVMMMIMTLSCRHLLDKEELLVVPHLNIGMDR